MPYRYQMTVQNERGDNGWWKKTGDTLAHYFTKKLPLCGTAKFNHPDMGIQRKNAYDRRCKNCTKVRRNQLRARMNARYQEIGAPYGHLVIPKSHSPRKPQ